MISFQTNGEFDYVYNTSNQPVGTFAVGTTADLGQRIALNVGTNTRHLTSSLSAVPEPSTWAMMLLGFSGLVFLRLSSNARPAEASGT